MDGNHLSVIHSSVMSFLSAFMSVKTKTPMILQTENAFQKNYSLLIHQQNYFASD
jgi:hypothetical protein